MAQMPARVNIGPPRISQRRGVTRNRARLAVAASAISPPVQVLSPCRAAVCTHRSGSVSFFIEPLGSTRRIRDSAVRMNRRQTTNR